MIHPMNRRNTNLLLTMLCILLILFLGGCGKAKEISDVQLLDDLLGTYDIYLHHTTVSKSEVLSKAMSSTKEQCTARVCVMSGNDSVSCKLTYELNYTALKKSWELSNVSLLSAQIVPLTGMETAKAMKFAAGVLGAELQYDHEEADFANCRQTHYVHRQTSFPYMTQMETFAVACIFDTTTMEWTAMDCELVNTTYDWDALGMWTCSGEDVDVRAVKVYPYSYSATVMVTQEDTDTLKVVYEVVGFLRHDNNISGTVYFDLRDNPYHEANYYQSHERWYLESEGIDSFATIRFDAEKGLQLRQDGSGVMTCTRD